MKKFSINIFFIVLSLLVFPDFVLANECFEGDRVSCEYKYVIDSYDVDIIVNEDNSYNITETIDAYFIVPSHGLLKTIPLFNRLIGEDGSVIDKNWAKVSNLEINDEFILKEQIQDYVIRVGSEDTEIIGKKQYVISYDYAISKDQDKDFDLLYFNIIPSVRSVPIKDVTFNIVMPKVFDKNKISFHDGFYGKNVQYEVNGNVIIGKHNGILDSNNGLTIKLELEEGYFKYFEYKIEQSTYLYFIIPVLFLFISLLIWYIFGKDDIVVDTVEFYPPNNMNSLEIGFNYKGEAIGKDVMSLLIYLANKGYIKIETKKGLVGLSKYDVIKLKDYDGDNPYEDKFLNGLFDINNKYLRKKYVNDEGLISNMNLQDLKNDGVFPLVIKNILRKINKLRNKNKILKIGFFRSLIVVSMICISLFTIVYFPTMLYSNMIAVISSLLIFSVFTFIFGYLLVSIKKKKYENIGGVIFYSFLGLIFLFIFGPQPIFTVIKDEIIFLIGTIVGLISVVGMIICLMYMSKRNQYGNELFGRIKGFKKFLETAEKERLEALVEEKPTYFYDILPYAYVLGVSDKWISNFESLDMIPDDFNNFAFNDLDDFDSMMDSFDTMDSDSDSDGGGSGGGSLDSW